MKLGIKFLMIMIIIALSYSIKLRQVQKGDDLKEEQDDKKEKIEVPIKERIEQGIEKLFGLTSDTGCKTKNPEKLKKKSNYKVEGMAEPPKQKPNPFKNFYLGDSGYMMDYLSDEFYRAIVTKFKDVWRKANNVIELGDDPYSDENISFAFVDALKNTTATQRNGLTTPFSVPKLRRILKEWGWVRKDLVDYEKTVFDNFDFKGRGRLNAKEFLLLSILQNIPLYGKGVCTDSDYCYDDIFREYIDPMFYYMDCDKDGKIKAEDIWEGLKKLKGANKKYNMFACVIPIGGIDKEIHTPSVDEFVLLNSENNTGYLNLNEFRRGMLLGAWQRNVDFTQGVLTESDLSNAYGEAMKKRWKNGIDKKCELVRQFSYEANQPKTN